MSRGAVASSCAAVLLAFAVSAAAQTSSQAPTQAPVEGSGAQKAPNAQRSTASARTSTDQDVVVIGCVQLAPKAAAGSAGNRLILADAVLSDESPHPAATTGESEPPATSSQPSPGDVKTSQTRSYLLTGTESKQLAQYVGHRIAVTGRIEGGALPPSGSTGGADATATGTRMPRVTVVSVKPQSGTCS